MRSVSCDMSGMSHVWNVNPFLLAPWLFFVRSRLSSAVGNRDLNPQHFAGRAPHLSPSRVPGAITESAASPAVIAATTSPPDKARDAASKRRSSANGSANASGSGSGSGSGSKPKPSAAASLTSRILPFPKEIRARMSSGSSSASSGDGRKNSDGTPRRDREQAGRGGDGGGERNSKKKNSDRSGAVKKPRNSQPRSPGGMGRVEQATGPPPSGVGVKMWSGESTTREAAAAAAAPAPAVPVPVSSPAAGGKVLQGIRNKFVSQPRAAQADGPSQGQGAGAGAAGVRAVQASPKVEVSSLSSKGPQAWRGRQPRPPP